MTTPQTCNQTYTHKRHLSPGGRRSPIPALTRGFKTIYTQAVHCLCYVTPRAQGSMLPCDGKLLASKHWVGSKVLQSPEAAQIQHSANTGLHAQHNTARQTPVFWSIQLHSVGSDPPLRTPTLPRYHTSFITASPQFCCNFIAKASRPHHAYTAHCTAQ